MKNYTWMQPAQKELFVNFCKAFEVKTISDIGRKLDMKNPYHSVYQMFRTKTPNKILAFMLKDKLENAAN